MAEIEDFEKLDVRLGRVVEVENFLEAKNPSYKLKIDFGNKVGIKKSSAQLIENYSKEELINKLVLGIVNLPSKRIAPFLSECLILGVPDEKNNCVLIKPDKEVPLGAKLY